MNSKGYIHSTESFGSVDGPGIRFLIFLQGCQMRCRYCHNPDTWRLGSDACGTTATVDELLNKAERYRSYWGPDGGITVSGGEALLQIDFLIDLFEEAHRRGINTCLDTAAQPFTREEPFFGKFQRLMQTTDLVLLARYLSDINKPVWIRHVLVPGITTDEEQLIQLRQTIDTLQNVQKVEVLPYHTLGTFKWEQLGIPYSLKDVATPTAEQIARAREILTAK